MASIETFPESILVATDGSDAARDAPASVLGIDLIEENVSRSAVTYRNGSLQSMMTPCCGQTYLQ